MVFVGIGSNLGSRKANLRLACDHLKILAKNSTDSNLFISSVYESEALLKPDSPGEWNRPYLNAVVGLETKLKPPQFLEELKKIEKKIGRKDRKIWAPREIDLDILLWNSEKISLPGLTIPHKGLMERPFALLPLVEIISKISEKNFENLESEPDRKYLNHFGYMSQIEKWKSHMPFDTRKISFQIFLPELVGILNVTPDSFSDGDLYLDPENALNRAKELVKDGASVIDIGAESTRPNATPVAPEKEWARLEPVLRILIPEIKNVILSLDTRHAKTAKKALDLGVHWINDVSGFEDPEMCKVVADSDATLVFMHNLGVPPSKDKVMNENQDIVSQLSQWIDGRLKRFGEYGIKNERLVFDPGIGFGKSASQSLEILKRADELLAFNFRVLIGHSRKSFLASFSDDAEKEGTSRTSKRDIETLAISLELARKNIHYL